MIDRVIEWDGAHVPDGLRELPPGLYLIQPVGDDAELTPEEETGLDLALDQIEAGETVAHEAVIREFRQRALHR